MKLISVACLWRRTDGCRCLALIASLSEMRDGETVDSGKYAWGKNLLSNRNDSGYVKSSEEHCVLNAREESQASSLLGQINDASTERRITPPTTRRVSMIGMGKTSARSIFVPTNVRTTARPILR